jgi:HemY protein
MADLEESMNAGQESVRQWLARATTAEPDKSWVCGSCGAATSAWTARCGNCDAFNALDWRVPPHVLTLGTTQETITSEANALTAGS